ncbi:MAG: hypothetical protein KC420_06610 [Myxococcales bacterium]|nr:hypothetical protein [Myxococcales bacterium]
MPENTRRRRIRRASGGWLAAAAAAALVLVGVASEASAAGTKSLCVFDPGGASGDLFNKMKDYQSQAVGWGVSFDLKPYTDESVAASDFRNKKCDAVLLTGVTGQEFNRKTYSLEAMGLFTSYSGLQKAIGALAKPKAAKFSVDGAYETVGIYPAGAVYLHLRDRSKAELSKLSGASIATIKGDPAARTMVNEVGATAKLAEVSTFASYFNNGSVDICYSPATAYKPLELYRGVGDRGGVVRFPLAQLTFQLFVRSEEFPAGFGDASRAWVSEQFPAMLRVIQQAEREVNQWIDVDAGDVSRYTELLRKVRESLVGGGTYDPTIIKLGERVAG